MLFSNRSHSPSPKIPASGSCVNEKTFLFRYFEAKESMKYVISHKIMCPLCAYKLYFFIVDQSFWYPNMDIVLCGTPLIVKIMMTQVIIQSNWQTPI